MYTIHVVLCLKKKKTGSPIQQLDVLKSHVSLSTIPKTYAFNCNLKKIISSLTWWNTEAILFGWCVRWACSPGCLRLSWILGTVDLFKHDEGRRVIRKHPCLAYKCWFHLSVCYSFVWSCVLDHLYKWYEIFLEGIQVDSYPAWNKVFFSTKSNMLWLL